jgi:hypothetical protein
VILEEVPVADVRRACAKSYDTDAIREDLEAKGVATVIPPRRSRKLQPVSG